MTDVPNWLALLISTATPVLPSALVLRWAQPLFWAVVLAFAASMVLVRCRSRLRFTLVALAGLWSLVLGPWSPSWWLALAFQLPSWTTVLASAWGLTQAWKSLSFKATTNVSQAPPSHTDRAGSGSAMVWLGLALGLLLMLDMFILLPFNLYRWGFSGAALALLALGTAVAWLLADKGSAARQHALLIGLALALHVVTRLPSGNAFDAVIDPWLWLVLLIRVAGRLVSRPGRHSTSTTTRG